VPGDDCAEVAGVGVVNPNCGDCGDEDGDNHMDCCGIWLCDDCADAHGEKWGRSQEPIPYTITAKGKAMLEGK
jgi:hypothetical protein